jgi:hypothetical protein
MSAIAQDALQRVAKGDLVTPAERDKGQEQTAGAELRRMVQMIEKGNEVDTTDLRSLIARQHAITAGETSTGKQRQEARSNIMRLTGGGHQRYLDRLPKKEMAKYQEEYRKKFNTLKKSP